MQILLVLYCKVQAVFKENDKILLPLMRYCMMPSRHSEIAPCKGIQIPGMLVESKILGFGIRNPTKEWNPESKFH